MNSPRPTVRSIAAEAGVSAATVALALNNSNRISADTRKRIQALAERAGYRPDPAVRKLMQHLRDRWDRRQRASIAFIVPPPEAPRYFTPLLQAGVTERAAELGYTVTVLPFSNRAPECLRFTAGLRARGIDGLVFAPLSETEPLHAGVDLSGFSVVSASASILAPQFNRVVPNHFSNVLEACRALARQGYVRIGMAISPNKNLRDRHQSIGALACHASLSGLAPLSPLVIANPEPAPLLDWIRRERPDAIITERPFEDLIADLPIQKLPGRRAPALVSLIGIGPRAAAGIDLREQEIGRATIDLLSGQLERGETGIPAHPRSTIIDGVWREAPGRFEPRVASSTTPGGEPKAAARARGSRAAR